MQNQDLNHVTLNSGANFRNNVKVGGTNRPTDSYYNAVKQWEPKKQASKSMSQCMNYC